ncbi:MAG: Stage II sporulation protein E [uncultured Chloroflexia bacterium]|uniref:Stage II sporulation protein E n=1 Tax=uncultured Chloroflexia bacterium TaxID=1672391 RepID=A0A6J4IFI3_9CHLR|nr:MAG: Stage II sporulation protein E [uncultured Chloroflexia bacterium]
MLEVQVAVAKVGKYASGESGDTVEHIERPLGGFSFVVADGQGSGRGAKTLSNLVTARAITMLKDGARDGAVARAVHDYLYGYRNGKVSSTLNILSVDFAARSILMSRNSPCPFYVMDAHGLTLFDEPSTPIGLYPNTKPVISQIELAGPRYLVAFTDGIMQAGTRYGAAIDLSNSLAAVNMDEVQEPRDLAESILARAIELDHGRPNDDMSVIVLGVCEKDDEQLRVRRMHVTFPVEDVRKV